MGKIFHPGVVLMGRFRYAYKIVLIPALVLVPLGWVLTAYVGVQNGQVSFSAKERDGVAYLLPLAELATKTATARHAAVTGRPPVPLTDDIAAVDAVDRRLGGELGTSADWADAKGALSGIPSGRAAFDAHNTAEDKLLALIVKVSDGSNLTLDPDLDTYYAMDALVFRLPPLIQAAGRTIDEAVLAKDADAQAAEATRINLALSGGTLSAMRTSVSAGLSTAYAKTADGHFETRTAAAAKLLDDTAGTLLDQVTTAVRGGDLTAVSTTSGQETLSAASALGKVLAPELDRLISARIDGFEAAALRVEVVTALALLLVAYLMVGFYRSTTGPLRRVVTALDGLAGGDLTGTVPVETRDEVGAMSRALNEAIGRMRQTVRAIIDKAGDVAGSSEQLSAVSDQLRSGVENTTARAAEARVAADDVSAHVETVAASAEEMTSSIRSIADSASEAATVAVTATSAVDNTEGTVSKLGDSSARIGDVVQAITAIAAQTNLLALNATIEAARAGEAGRGFAIVAGEVKALAQQTAAATDEIIGSVHAIKGDTAAAATAIMEIRRVIDRMSELQASIASAAEQQTAATNEISRTVSDASVRSGEIALGIGQVAEHSAQTTGAAASTQRAAGDLARTAAELHEIVGAFRS